MEWAIFKEYVWLPLIALLGFLMRHNFQRNSNRLDDLEKEHGSCKLEVSNLRTHISENYSTKAETTSLKVEQINASNRIHDRLDKIFDLLQSKP